VHENDIFPEEFPRFLGFRPDLLETLVEYYGDLFQAGAWRRVQTALRAVGKSGQSAKDSTKSKQLTGS
jgi:isocitrate dehydrogenase kinase/phosphatase